jgi:hypothetical protein
MSRVIEPVAVGLSLTSEDITGDKSQGITLSAWGQIERFNYYVMIEWLSPLKM